MFVDGIPVQFAAARVNIYVPRPKPPLALPDETADPEGDDDGEGEVRLEEALDVVVAAPGGADGDEELSETLSRVSQVGCIFE